jgi:O-antigen ligase
VATVVLISTTLFLSPVANKKITQAYEEAVHFDKNIYNNVYTSIGVRIMFWRNTLSIIPEHPFIGVGTAGFEQVYAKAVAGQPHLAGLLTNDPHNQYMKFAIEQGLFGLAIFLGLVIAVARQAANEPYRTLGISVLLTWCCTSLGNAHFSTFSEGHFIWIWLGIMLATDSRPRQAALGAARS